MSIKNSKKKEKSQDRLFRWPRKRRRGPFHDFQTCALCGRLKCRTALPGRLAMRSARKGCPAGTDHQIWRTMAPVGRPNEVAAGRSFCPATHQFLSLRATCPSGQKISHRWTWMHTCLFHLREALSISGSDLIGQRPRQAFAKKSSARQPL